MSPVLGAGALDIARRDVATVLDTAAHANRILYTRHPSATGGKR